MCKLGRLGNWALQVAHWLYKVFKPFFIFFFYLICAMNYDNFLLFFKFWIPFVILYGSAQFNAQFMFLVKVVH